MRFLAVLLAVLPLASVALGAAPVKKPKFVVTEAARRAMLRAAAVMEDAAKPEDYADAGRLFEEAIAAAPGWPDPHFNLAKARELRGDYAGAVASLKKYVELGGADARQAQDYLYKLEIRGERAGKAAAAAASEKAFEGPWYRMLRWGDRSEHRYSLAIKKDAEGRYIFTGGYDGGNEYKMIGIRDVKIAGSTLSYSQDEIIQPSTVCATHEVTGTLSPDGNTLTLDHRLVPLSPHRSDSCPLPKYYGSHVDDWKK